MENQQKFSAIIVSGGLNSRMGGKNKAFLKIGGKTILSRQLNLLGKLFQDIVLVTRSPHHYKDYPVHLVTDIYEARSSLTGLHAGLYYAENDFSFVIPCDAPFIQEPLIHLIMGFVEPENDVVIPFYDGHYEPLCAVYSKRCVPEIEALLNIDDFRIYNFFKNIDLKTIPKATLQEADPGLISFFNVNTPESLEQAIKAAEALK